MQPLVLVPAKEVWNFLASINEALKLDWGFTKTPNVSGFLISFSDDGQPRPRFLGTSRSRPEFERLEKSIPAEDPQDFNEISKGLAIGDENTQKFRTKVEMAYALSRPAKVRVKTKEQRKIEAKESKSTRAPAYPHRLIMNMKGGTGNYVEHKDIWVFANVKISGSLENHWIRHLPVLT